MWQNSRPYCSCLIKYCQGLKESHPPPLNLCKSYCSSSFHFLCEACLPWLLLFHSLGVAPSAWSPSALHVWASKSGQFLLPHTSLRLLWGSCLPCSHWLDWELTQCKAQVRCEGEQNMSPENVHLWHKDYFKLTIFRKEQTQEKLWKWIEVTLLWGTFTLERVPVPERELLPETTLHLRVLSAWQGNFVCSSHLLINCLPT